jgi:bleomycin hydrolase
MKKTRSKSLLFSLIILLIALSTAIASDKDKSEQPDKQFKIVKEVWRTPYKSQGKTGTCWSFSTTSFLESEAHRLGRGEFELSQMFIAYYAYLEKAQRNARRHGKGVFAQGGLPHDVIYIIDKYGTVPLSDYSGLPRGEERHNHREMFKILRGVMKSVIDSGEDRDLTSEWIDGTLHSKWLDSMGDIMGNHLGVIPQTIQYNGSEMTPVQFSSDVLDLPLDDYIEITSYSYLPLFGSGELYLSDNWLHYDDYYNLPIDDFIRCFDYALDNGFSLVLDLSITNAHYTSKKGYCELDPELENGVIDQNARDTMLENWKTVDQHLEHCVGLAKDEDGKKFYYVKDSVGPEDGSYKSLEYFSENFLRAKCLFFMVHKDGVPDDIRKRLGL